MEGSRGKVEKGSKDRKGREQGQEAGRREKEEGWGACTGKEEEQGEGSGIRTEREGKRNRELAQ